MAYQVLTVAQATAQADRIQSRLNAEVKRAGAAMNPPWAPPTFGGIGPVLASNNCRVVVETTDDDVPGNPKTIAVFWRDAADPAGEVWVLHLWGPSTKLLAMGSFVCSGLTARFGNGAVAKWGVGLPYSNRFAQITGATITDGVAKVLVTNAKAAIDALIAGGQTS